MKNFFGVFFGLFLLNATAYANDSSSEYFYQAQAGETYFEGNINYRALTMEGTAGGEIDVTDTMLNAYFEKGFNKTYSGYVSLGYGSGETDNNQPGGTNDFKGLDMLFVGGKYNRYSEKDRFLGRAEIGYGLTEQDDENRVGNQLVLNLAVGYERYVSDNGTLGALLSYAVLATDTKFENGPDSANKGNLDLTGYYEHKNEDMVFGGKLAYTKGSFNYYQGFYPEDFDFGLITVGGYTRVPMTDSFYLLASLDYKTSMSEPDGFDSLSGFDVSLGGRLLF